MRIRIVVTRRFLFYFKGSDINLRFCPISLKGFLRGAFHQSRDFRLDGSFGPFFPLQHGGLRGLPYQVLQPQSQETDRPVEYDSRCGVPVPPSDAAAEAEATAGFLFLRGEGREGEDGLSGEVPRKSMSTSSPSVSPAWPINQHQLCPSHPSSLELTFEDTGNVFTLLFAVFWTRFCLPIPGVFSCKRGELQRADGGQLPVSAGAAPGAGHLSLQRPGLPMRPVRGHGDRDQPGQRGFRQVHLRRYVPLLQQGQNNGLRGWTCHQIPHRSADKLLSLIQITQHTLPTSDHANFKWILLQTN